MSLFPEHQGVGGMNIETSTLASWPLRSLQQPETDSEANAIKEWKTTSLVWAGDMEDLAVLNIRWMNNVATQRGVHDDSLVEVGKVRERSRGNNGEHR